MSEIDAALAASPAPDPVAWLDRPGAPSLEELEAYRKHVIAPDLAEAMRAKCEAIARDGSFTFDIKVWHVSTKKEMTALVALAIADAIAALKGNGERL